LMPFDFWLKMLFTNDVVVSWCILINDFSQ
jgi:hypothetical protein